MSCARYWRRFPSKCFFLFSIFFFSFHHPWIKCSVSIMCFFFSSFAIWSIMSFFSHHAFPNIIMFPFCLARFFFSIPIMAPSFFSIMLVRWRRFSIMVDDPIMLGFSTGLARFFPSTDPFCVCAVCFLAVVFGAFFSIHVLVSVRVFFFPSSDICAFFHFPFCGGFFFPSMVRFVLLRVFPSGFFFFRFPSMFARFFVFARSHFFGF